MTHRGRQVLPAFASESVSEVRVADEPLRSRTVDGDELVSVPDAVLVLVLCLLMCFDIAQSPARFLCNIDNNTEGGSSNANPLTLFRQKVAQ